MKLDFIVKKLLRLREAIINTACTTEIDGDIYLLVKDTHHTCAECDLYKVKCRGGKFRYCRYHDDKIFKKIYGKG